MQYLLILPGVLLGAGEFFLTRVISVRVLNGGKFLPLLLLKLLSYAGIFTLIFFLVKAGMVISFAAGLGGGILASALLYSIYTILKEKR